MHISRLVYHISTYIGLLRYRQYRCFAVCQCHAQSFKVWAVFTGFAMVEGAPVKMVDSILKYVQQRARSMTGDALERLIAAQCQACVLHLRSASMSYDDAHAILNLLGSDTCVFTHEQVAQVSAVVDQKLSPDRAFVWYM